MLLGNTHIMQLCIKLIDAAIIINIISCFVQTMLFENSNVAQTKEMATEVSNNAFGKQTPNQVQT